MFAVTASDAESCFPVSTIELAKAQLAKVRDLEARRKAGEPVTKDRITREWRKLAKLSQQFTLIEARVFLRWSLREDKR